MRRSAVLFMGIMVLSAAVPALAQETAASSSPSPFPATVAMRWVHVLSAITLMGGTLFVRFVLRPSALQVLDETTRPLLVAAVKARWKKFVMILTALLLLSGFYNYLLVTRHEHDGEALYHALFGIKFLLSMVVFALAAFLVGTTGIGRKLQSNEVLWLNILLLLAAATVMVGGYMKVM